MKLVLGFTLAFTIGAVCRLARIPSPAPNALLGSLLVVAMSVGYIAAGRVLARPHVVSKFNHMEKSYAGNRI